MTGHASLYLSRPVRAAILLVATVVAVVLDQWTKIYAVTHWKGLPPIIFFRDLFRIEYAENHGAFLSLLANMPDAVRFWILTVINGSVLLGLMIFLLCARRVPFSTYLPLLLVVIGGIGNLIDRIRFNYVIDFLNLGIGNLRTGIFNVADMFITAGFILMGIYLLKGETANEATLPAPPPPDGEGPAQDVQRISLPGLGGEGRV